MEILESNTNSQQNSERLMQVHKGATMVDDRYVIMQAEREKVLKNHLQDGKVHTFPSKEKKKIVVLQYIAEQFVQDKIYSEKEVNEILKDLVDDHVSVRRYLIEIGRASCRERV